MPREPNPWASVTKEELEGHVITILTTFPDRPAVAWAFLNLLRERCECEAPHLAYLVPARPQ